MKIRKMTVPIRWVVPKVAVLFIVLLLVTPKAVQAQQATTLKFASHQATNSYLNKMLFRFIERFNKSNQKAKIEFLGGPEVVPVFEALKYINKGTVDLYLGTPGFFAGAIPASLASYNIYVPAKTLRQTDFFKLMDEIHRKKGVTILGDFGRGGGIGTFLKKPIEKADFSGLKLRTTPHLAPLVQALGGSPVTTAPAEVYTALERGVVDGFLYPQGTGIIETRWYEVTKYVVDPMIPYTGCLFIMGNSSRWDALPKDVREQFMALVKEVEVESWDFDKNDSEQATHELITSGKLKKCTLPPAEASKYERVAKDALWQLIVSKDPDYGPKFKKIDEQVKSKP